MIECSGLACGHSGQPVLSQVDLKVREGEILVLVGLNGCGKSTLLRTLSGLLPPIGGQVLLNGQDISRMKGRELAKQIAFLPQSRDLSALTVESLTAHGRFPHLGFVRRPSAADREICEKAMCSAGVAELGKRSLSTLSGGQRQRAYIAMALAQDTPVILLDEPTTFLDIGAQFEILDLLRKINSEGKTILVALHDLSHALSLGTRAAVIDGGQLLCCAPCGEIYESGVLERIFGVRLIRMGEQYACLRQTSP